MQAELADQLCKRIETLRADQPAPIPATDDDTTDRPHPTTDEVADQHTAHWRRPPARAPAA